MDNPAAYERMPNECLLSCLQQPEYQIVVSGGFSKTDVTKSMEALPNADQVTQSVTWNGFPAVLPERQFIMIS